MQPLGAAPGQLHDIASGQIAGARAHFAVASFLQQLRDGA